MNIGKGKSNQDRKQRSGSILPPANCFLISAG